MVPAGTNADRDALAAAIAGALDGELARFKHPRRYLFVDQLPRNAMSKVQKAALRTAHRSLFVERD